MCPGSSHECPRDATHLVLSVGGNDALSHSDLLERRARNGAEVLTWFGKATADFAERYRTLMNRIAREKRADQGVFICTIYDGNLGPELHRAATAAIALFNDAISRAAREQAWRVIELRDLFTSATDYANPIEPSVQGGAKLAETISRAVLGSVGA
jgi:hypothetical protein